MSNIVIAILVIAWASLGFYFIMSQPKHGVKVIDCTWAEISPDFTPEMKELCRKARSGRV
jgi:hypothetical protein